MLCCIYYICWHECEVDSRNNRASERIKHEWIEQVTRKVNTSACVQILTRFLYSFDNFHLLLHKMLTQTLTHTPRTTFNEYLQENKNEQRHFDTSWRIKFRRFFFANKTIFFIDLIHIHKHQVRQLLCSCKIWILVCLFYTQTHLFCDQNTRLQLAIETVYFLFYFFFWCQCQFIISFH